MVRMRSSDLNLRHLAAVAAVRSAGSISGAARLVHLTQPAITQALTKLERQLDVPLFVRRPDGMAATSAGSALATRIEAALRLIGSRRATMAQVRAFLALAEHGTYAAAGRALGLAEASLHRAVADLSVALGATLFERRGRGVVLSERGRKAARGLGLAMVEIEAALADIAALRGDEAGRIVVGAMPLARARLLPSAIIGFHAAHPKADITIVEGTHAGMVDLLRTGRIDLMIGAVRADLPSDLAATPLFEDVPVIVGRRGHPLGRHGSPLLAGDLLAYPWLVAGDGTPLRALWRRMFERLDAVPPHVSIECGSVITVRQLLIAGDHLALVSADQVRAEIDAGWLELFGPAPGDLARTIGVTTRSDWRPTARQAQFLQHLTTAAQQIHS